jgi:hypothetical protein
MASATGAVVAIRRFCFVRLGAAAGAGGAAGVGKPAKAHIGQGFMPK